MTEWVVCVKVHWFLLIVAGLSVDGSLSPVRAMSV